MAPVTRQQQEGPPPSARATELNPTAASLLGFLHGGDLTGYDLVQVAEMVIGDFWSLTRSQVYRELGGLAARHLVEEQETGPRARRPYRITAAGKEAFAAWLADPAAEEQIRYPLLLKMSFGGLLDPATVLGFLEQRRPQHQQRLADYEAKAGTLGDPYLETVLAFGVHYERAVLAWMEQATERLAPHDEPAAAATGRRRSGAARGRARPGS